MDKKIKKPTKKQLPSMHIVKEVADDQKVVSITIKNVRGDSYKVEIGSKAIEGMQKNHMIDSEWIMRTFFNTLLNEIEDLNKFLDIKKKKRGKN